MSLHFFRIAVAKIQHFCEKQNFGEEKFLVNAFFMEFSMGMGDESMLLLGKEKAADKAEEGSF